MNVQLPRETTDGIASRCLLQDELSEASKARVAASLGLAAATRVLSTTRGNCTEFPTPWIECRPPGCRLSCTVTRQIVLRCFVV